MADERKIQLAATLDVTGVKEGTTEIKREAESMAQAVGKAGQSAGKAFDGVGVGGVGAANKVDAATKSMIQSIQRTTALMEAGSKTSGKYYEALAAQRGVDVNTLKPYLDQLDAVAGKQTNVGMSAKQTAFAMRQIPMQFTDIITSLQAGQAPMTVLLQQGGQLKDALGGIGPAAKALGGYVAGLINPFVLAAGAVGGLAFAYHKGSEEAGAYSKALITTGNAAGTTVDQLQDMARSIDQVTGTQAAAAEALAQFASNGNIASNNLERFATIALKVEKETGQAISETVKQFAELGKSPIEASLKLNETTRFLTVATYEQIKALEEQGRTSEAAAKAQSAYAEVMESRLGQLEGRLGLIERAWRGVTSVAKEAWDAMLDIGRKDTNTEQLTSVSNQIASIRAKLEGLDQGPRSGASNTAIRKAKEQLDSLLEVQRTLQENGRLEQKSADLQKAEADRVKARAAFDKNGEQFLSNQAKMEREVAKARNDGAAAGLAQAQIEERVAQIREKFKDKGAISSAIQLNKSQLSSDIEAIKNANDQLVGSYANAEKIMEAQRSAGLISDHDYYESKRAFIELETQAKEDALKKEIARYEQEKLSGKDKIENDKKIAEAAAKLATLRADSSAKQEVLSTQEQAAMRRQESAYLSARQAAQDYFDTIQRQQERDLAGLGQGARQRSFNAGVNQIEDRYASQRRDLENQKAQLELEGKFTEEARKQYEKRLGLINEFQSKSIESYTDYYARLTDAQSHWEVGASEALNNYLDFSSNVAAQTEDFFTNTFRGMEDALVDFVMTGKASFSDLAKSIIADIIRIQARQAIAGFGQGLLGSLFGGSQTSNVASGGFGTSIGGAPVVVAELGRVFDGGKVTAFANGGSFTNGIVSQPTAFNMGLMGEAGPEAIMPLRRGPDGSLGVQVNGGSSKQSVNIDVHVDASGSQVEGEGPQASQLGSMIGNAVRGVLVQEMRPGGLLAA